MNMTRKKKRTESAEAPAPLITPSPKEATQLTDSELKSFNDFVKKIKIASPKEGQQTADQINAMLREYTSCYLLMGYNLENRAMVLSYADNMRDANAITELLRQVFFDASGGPNNDE